MSGNCIAQIFAFIPITRLPDFLQNIRRFDADNYGCHFRITVTSDTDESPQQIATLLKTINPPMPFITFASLNNAATQESSLEDQHEIENLESYLAFSKARAELIDEWVLEGGEIADITEALTLDEAQVQSIVNRRNPKASCN